jgi:replicative DNA helicase
MIKKKAAHVSKIKDQPHSAEAEQGLIGSMLMDPHIIPNLLDKVEVEDFYLPQHQMVFQGVISMHSQGKKIDMITLTQFLRDTGDLIKIGGASYLTSCFTFVPSASNSAYYLEIIKDQRLLRDLIERSEKTINYATAKGEFFSIPEILSRAQLAFGSMKIFKSAPAKTLADDMDEKMRRMESGEPDEDLILTHITRLDEYSPLRKGDMPLIKARHKVGKSTLGLTILENICITNQLPGLYFSLEDRTAKVIDRLLAGISRVPSHKHHVKKLSQDEMDRCGKAALKISSSNLIVVDDIYDLGGMVAKAKKVFIDNPSLGLVVVDYAQLIDVPVKKSDTREREVAMVSRAWRQFALSSGVPVILISQTNKDGDSRESRALEQDCTACWALLEDEEEDPSKRTILVEFQRNGESHVSIPVRFLGEINRVENPAPPPNEKLAFDIRK